MPITTHNIECSWGVWSQHIIGGPQSTSDPENPIAASHKGPVMAYLAGVDNAATSPATGLKWFKIGQDTLDTATKKWGVDHLNANSGWANFTLPTCVATGQSLMRVKIIALHSAYSQDGAQFYNSCGQLSIGDSGTLSPRL